MLDTENNLFLIDTDGMTTKSQISCRTTYEYSNGLNLI